jgi:HAE1 family hydrophobic/amphiphilic exporter-1
MRLSAIERGKKNGGPRRCGPPPDAAPAGSNRNRGVTPDRRTTGGRPGCGPWLSLKRRAAAGVYSFPGETRSRLLAGLALLAALVAAPGIAGGQEAPPADSLRLTVHEAVELALTANEQTRIARAAVDRTEGQVREAFARAMPTIDGSYRFTRNLQRPVLFFDQEGETEQIQIGNATEHAFDLSLEQPVIDFSLGSAVAAARHGTAASEALYDRTLSDVALQTRRAYYDVLLAQADVAVAANALDLAGRRLEQVQLFFDVGTAAEFDLLTARVAVESARPEQIRAENALRLAHNELKRVTGLPYDRGVELADSLAFEPVAVSLEEAVRTAQESRGDLIAERRTVELNAELVDVQRSEALPSISLFLNLNRRSSSEELWPEDRDFTQSATAALALDIPIFDGRRTQGRTLQARADYVAAVERLHALERDVELQVLDAWQSVQAAAEGVRATSATVDLARRAYDIATVRFRSGLSTQLELDVAEQDLIEAQSIAAEALYLHMLARAALLHAMGGT